MKRMKRKIGILVMMAVMVLTSGFLAFADDAVGAAAAKADGAYTIQDMLRYALEDERMAQAAYQTIMDAFDVERPFANIKVAEGRHEAAVLRLYEARGLEAPAFDAKAHVQTPESLEAAYAVAIQAEIENIAMYEAFLSQELDDDMRAVFEALHAGSAAHLKAFERAAAGNCAAEGARNGNGNAYAYGKSNTEGAKGARRNADNAWARGHRQGANGAAGQRGRTETCPLLTP